MPDNGCRIVLVFFQKFFGTRKSNLIDVFSTSSRVIPIPLSEIVSVPASLSAFTRTFNSPSSPLNSPEEARTFSF